MPRRGVPNNPGGANGATDPVTGVTSAAGLIQRRMDLTQGVATAPGQNAPRQAQRAAVKPGSKGSPAQAVPGMVLHAPPSAPQPLTYQQQLSGVWTQIAATAGASPLVQQIAEQARNV